MIQIIIEGQDNCWTANRPDWPELGRVMGDTPTRALQNLNLKAYWAHDAVRTARDEAFKSIRRHFRASVGYPMWGPHWLLRRLHRETVEAHYELVQEVARELDARPQGGSWVELAAIVNERW